MERISRIVPADRGAMKRAQARFDAVAKPLHSLGLLEQAVIRIAGMTGKEDVCLDRRAAVVMCADNGVVAEGVTQTGSEVTALVAEAVAAGRANISRLAQLYGAEAIAVDIGMKTDGKNPAILRRKIACGTGNIAEGPAMSVEQAARAISTGIDLVGELKERGIRILVAGEMGIGNTTTTGALASVLLRRPPEEVTGRGAGLSRAGLENKLCVIRRAIAKNHGEELAERPLELLARLGGFDIAGMTGLFLGGAIYRIPVVIDGVISAAAALLAVRMAPAAVEYLLASHVSAEPAGRLLLEALGLEPVLHAGLCLGEGTGGSFLLPLLDGALAVYHTAHRFEDLSIRAYEEFADE